MDEIDAEILKLLSENSKLTYLSISEKISTLQDTTIRKRVVALESSGVIRKYTILLNPEKFPVILAAAQIEANPAMLMDVQASVQALDSVSQVFYNPSGSIFAFLAVGSDEELSSLMKEVNEIPGVQKVTLVSDLRVGKYDSLIPPKVIRKISAGMRKRGRKPNPQSMSHKTS